jgi:hypothetical protein
MREKGGGRREEGGRTVGVPEVESQPGVGGDSIHFEPDGA